MTRNLTVLLAGVSFVGPALFSSMPATAQQKDPAKQLAALLKQCKEKPPKNLIKALNCSDAETIQKCEKLPKDEAGRKKQAELLKFCQRFGVLLLMERIPVFTIIDKDGSPITETIKAQDKEGKPKDVAVGNFFMGETEAEAALKSAQKKNKGARLNPLSLKLALQLSGVTRKQIIYRFIANEQQTKQAKIILKNEGQESSKFIGIPLFYAIGGEGKNKGTLSISQGKQEAIPFYFDHADLKGMLTQLKKENSKLGKTTEAKVTTLKQMMNTLTDTPSDVGKIVLIPSRKTQQYLRKQK